MSITREFPAEVNTNVRLSTLNSTKSPAVATRTNNLDNEEIKVVFDPEYRIFTSRDIANELELQRSNAIEALPQEDVLGVIFGISKKKGIETHVKITSDSDQGPGSINDPKTGVVKGNDTCGTCQLKLMECAGHFGKIELQQAHFDGDIKTLRPAPILNPAYRREIISFLIIFCNSCGSLMLTKDQILDIEKTTYAANRIKLIEEYIKNKKTFTHTHRDSTIDEKCNFDQGGVSKCSPNFQYILDPRSSATSILYKLPNGDTGVRTIDDIIKIFDNISDEDAELIGLGNTRPKDFIMYNITVIPPRQRGAAVIETDIQSDRMADNYKAIIKANNALIKGTEKNGSRLTSTQIDKYKETIYESTRSMMMSSDKKGPRGQSQVSVSVQLKGKEGLMREGIQSARADYTARAVIGPDPNVPFGWFSVPEEFASKLTVAETVNSINLSEVNKLLQEQKITTVLRGSGNAKGTRKTVTPDNYLDIKLNIGDKVDRWLRDGDYLTLNRMPSLQKQSLMTGRIILRKQRNIGIPLFYTTPYNADFDGDEMNLHSVQGPEGMAEVQTLMTMAQCIPNEQNNSNIMGLVMDTVVAGYLLTSKDEEMTEAEWNQYIILIESVDFNSSDLDERLLEMGVKKYTGKALFSALLPPNLYYTKKDITIIKGVLVNGIITKDHIGASANSIIQVIYNTPSISGKSKTCGLNRAGQFITDANRVLGAFITNYGFTIGIQDCGYDIEEIDQIKKEELSKMRMEIAQLGLNVNASQENDKYEDQILVITNNYRSNIGKRIKELIPAENNFNIMISAKSKGNLDNFIKIAASVSQQTFGGKRMPRQISGGRRSLPHFEEDDMDPASQGMIESDLKGGLNATEFFLHASACREGVIQTAVDMSTVGTQSRNLSTMLGDLKVAYDMSVRDSNDMIVQERYGYDGFAGASLQKLVLNTDSPYADESLSIVDVFALAREINAEFGYY